MIENTYLDLNAEVNLWDNGKLQLDKDKDAARAYFREHVNKNTVFFHNLHEKTKYLVDNGYWDPDVAYRFDFEDFKALVKYAYSYKHRFDSLLGALKFYSSYALKTVDEEGTRYLERFEDRVVMNAVAYADDLEHAYDLIEAIITKRYQPATPTFMNAGRENWGAPVSCFLLRIDDNLESITRAQTDASQLSKRGGGVGLLLSNIREEGAPIKGKNGVAKGVVPIMKILEDTFSYVDQLGARQGAGAVYINAHHPDIMKFLDTKRENADEKIRIKSLSLGVVLPDITFELAKNNEEMYLFSPYDVERVYGVPFADISVTEKYREMVEDPRIHKKKVNTRRFFQTLAEVQFESGYPYIMYEDTVNRANPVPNVGKISMSNLCVTGDTEILTSKGYRRADDLYESQEDFEVIVDERARTMNLNNTGTSVQKSSKMFKTTVDADVYLVKTLEGHEIKATEWHKFYVDRDGELVKIPLAEMVPGDRILTQGAENPSWGEEHNPDLAYLAGVIASDGTFYQNRSEEHGVRIDLYGDKSQFKNQIEHSATTVLEGRDDLLHHSSSLEPKMVYSENADKWYLNSRPLAKVLFEEGFTIDSKLQIPEFVKRGDRETQQQYVNGVWAMDGCITGSVKHHVRSFELGSINKEFLREMQQLLLQFGIYTRIYANRKGASKSVLPDGKGGMKEYDVKPTWTLRANSIHDCSKLFDLVEWREFSKGRWEELKPQSRKTYRPQHKSRAVVQSIEFYGVEDVYDPTVENGHSVVYNGLVTGNCSEIFQPQTPSTFNAAGEFAEVGRDISCNLGSLNIDRVADLEENELYRTVSAAYRMLSNVSEDSNEDLACSPTIQRGNGESRAVGLGQMNLHGALIKRGIKYDSELGKDFFRSYMADITYAILSASAHRANMTGSPFSGFEGSRWQDGSMIATMMEHVPNNVGTIYKKSDWEKLQQAVMKSGLYNQHLQAIPPTGSISYINGSTSSIHPITAKVEARKEGQTGRLYYPAYGLTDENFSQVEDAYELGPEAVIDMYAVAQPFVDQGMSLTLFFKDTATTRDINRAQRYAHKAGVKSLYYIRMRNTVLSGTEMEDCVSCTL